MSLLRQRRIFLGGRVFEAGPPSRHGPLDLVLGLAGARTSARLRRKADEVVSGSGETHEDRIFAACADAAERGDLESIERACADHPHLADRIRAIVRVVTPRPETEVTAPPLGDALARYVVLEEIGCRSVLT